MSKFVFVRFEEDHGEFGTHTYTLMATGDAAQSHDAFIRRHAAGLPIRILEWFEVPERWDNRVSDNGDMKSALKAIVGLDELCESPMASDLLATIFETAYRLGAASKE